MHAAKADAHMHICTRTCLRFRASALPPACTRTRTHMHTRTRTDTHTDILRQTQAHARTHARTHARDAHTHTHARTHTLLRMHRWAHVRGRVRALPLACRDWLRACGRLLSHQNMHRATHCLPPLGKPKHVTAHVRMRQKSCSHTRCHTLMDGNSRTTAPPACPHARPRAHMPRVPAHTHMPNDQHTHARTRCCRRPAEAARKTSLQSEHACMRACARACVRVHVVLQV